MSEGNAKLTNGTEALEVAEVTRYVHPSLSVTHCAGRVLGFAYRAKDYTHPPSVVVSHHIC